MFVDEGENDKNNAALKVLKLYCFIYVSILINYTSKALGRGGNNSMKQGSDDRHAVA